VGSGAPPCFSMVGSVGLLARRAYTTASLTPQLTYLLLRAQVSASRPPHLKYHAQRAGIPEAKVVVRLQQLRSAVSFAREASATCPSLATRNLARQRSSPVLSPFPWPWANRSSSAIWRDLAGILGNQKASRRLAAILAADISGYGALMGADEEPPSAMSNRTKPSYCQ
jgi:hypothetical protein